MKTFLLWVLLLMTTSGFAANTTPANLFECTGAGITVNYTSSNLIGQPTLNISLEGKNYSAIGLEILDQETVLGSLLSLTKASVPDLYTDTLTFVKPNVNVSGFGETVSFFTRLFSTRNHTSIGGPQLVEGVIQNSQSKLLHCIATAAVF
jgi:hypothetical protein